MSGKSISVIFPDGHLRSVPAFEQRGLLDDSFTELFPEADQDWEFYKIDQVKGAKWRAVRRLEEKNHEK